MFVRNIKLTNFRNYSSRSFDFEKNVTVVVGQNGIGKTNIIESIYVLTHGKSWRTRYDFELIESTSNTLNLLGEVTKEGKDINLFIGIEKGFSNRSKKVYKIDDVKKSHSNFIQVLKSVLFSPHDLEIILGSPSTRRRFLNEVLSQVDKNYSRQVLELKKIVTARNSILKRINEGVSDYSELEYWNKKLVEVSGQISSKRNKLIEFINTDLSNTFSKVSNTQATCVLKYLDSKATYKRLQKYKLAEIASKRTLIGAQKDDFIILFSKNGYKDMDSKYYASRGEQRTLVFNLKLATLSFLQSNSINKVVLLLDDIYSELDEFHREAISEFFDDNQVIITTAEKSLVPESLLKVGKVIELT